MSDSWPTSAPYLILHKVRGEPAFDIAVKMEVDLDGEDWWIIPTSGHRAYPYWFKELYEAFNEMDGLPWEYHEPGPAFPDLPDHYDTHKAPKVDILSVLGLTKTKQQVTRR